MGAVLSLWNTHLLSVCSFNRAYAGAGCVHCSSYKVDWRGAVQPSTVRLPSHDAPMKINISYEHTSCSPQTCFYPQTKQAGGTCHFKNLRFLRDMKSHFHIVSKSLPANVCDIRFVTSMSLPANVCDIWFCVTMWPGFVSFASWHKQNM